MLSVDGIILIVSCFKYEKIREQFKIDNDKILNWKVIYLFGDLDLETDYILENDRLTIRCEDSYLYLIKKLILGMKIIRELFDIKEGILRCGDDLIFNIPHLMNFLRIDNKQDYIGKNFMKSDVVQPINSIDLDTNMQCLFMRNYYNRNENEKKQVNAHLATFNVYIDKLCLLPNIRESIALGHIYYLSNKSIDIIIDDFRKKENNVLYYNSKTNYYPYIYEDIGIGYILFKNNIDLHHYTNMWYNPHYNGFDTTGEFMCTHTNEGNI